MKKIYILAIALVMLLLSISVVSAGLFDGLFGEEQKDNVIEIDEISFNTTNVTKFNLYNESEGLKVFTGENLTGYTVDIYKFDEMDADQANVNMKDINDLKKSPSETINGVVIYNFTANFGEHVGESRYVSFIENKDLNTIIIFGTPDANETVKIASTLKFNEK